VKRTEQSEINLQSKFILNNIDEIKKCFNYKNIQPLWKLENKIKSNKLPSYLWTKWTEWSEI